MRRIVLVLIFSLIIVFNNVNTAMTRVEHQFDIYYLYLERCSNCYEAKKFLDSLSSEYYEVNIISVDIAERENMEILTQLSNYYNLDMIIAPTFIFEDQVIVGFNSKAEYQIWRYVNNVLDFDSSLEFEYSSSLLNNINTDRSSILFLTVIIALVDGFNPCSLWVLTLLLSFALNFRSRKKLCLIGGIFLIITVLIYGLFMTSTLKIIEYLDYYIHAGLIMSLFAVIFGIVSIANYFSKGNLGTITETGQNLLRNKMLKLIKIKNNWFIAGGTIIVASSAAIVELPCTAGFPVLWSNIVSQRGITGIHFYMLLSLYLLIYLLDEVVICSVVIVTLKIKRVSADTGKNLKLFSGLMMIFLGLVSYFTKSYISIFDSLLIFVFSCISFFIIVLVEKYYANYKTS